MEKTFKALADQTRRTLLDNLLEDPGLSLNQLVAVTDMRRQSVSKHIQILEDAGLIVSEWEGREKKHYLNPIPIQEISRRWVDKFSKTHIDAVLALKDALEADARMQPMSVARQIPPEPRPDKTVIRGPEVTSFFTPIED